MKLFISAIAVSLLVIGSASAGKPSGKSSYHGSNGIYISSYSLTYGKSFSGGIYYPGKVHSQWSYQCYWPKYGCNCYWCPSSCSYYYWYEPAGCYYPISYITVATPVYATAPLTIGVPPIGIPGLPR